MAETVTGPPASSRRALLAGGGSGGHVFPALAIGEELERRGWNVRLAGNANGIEARLAKERGFELVDLPAQPIVGRSLLRQLAAVWALLRSALTARRVVVADGVDLVVGTGGYASAPAVVGARWARRPTAIVEPNAEPGRANLWASRFADGAAVAFTSTGERLHCPSWTTGVPVRPEFFEAVAVRSDGKPRLLVLGGSQGSQRINELLPEVLGRLFEELPEVSVLHQCGARHLDSVRAAYAAAGIESPRLRVVPFVDNMPAAIGAVDLVISRAGAITLAEICAAGRPSLLLPLVLAGAHQVANARRLEDEGAAVVVEDHALDAPRLLREITLLFSDRARLVAMGAAARVLSRPGAAAEIADRLEALVESRRPRATLGVAA